MSSVCHLFILIIDAQEHCLKCSVSTIHSNKKFYVPDKILFLFDDSDDPYDRRL